MSPPADDSVVATVEDAVSHQGDREQRARAAAKAIRAAGEYRWVGIYDVTCQEVSIVAGHNTLIRGCLESFT